MLAKFSVLLALLTVNFAAATYVPRQAPGTQFITGPCQSDADCASGCCGFNTGKCAGAIVALERDGGCGFGDAQPNDNAARKLRGEAPAAPGTPPPANNGAGGAAAGSGKPPGTQFITGPCANDGECASGCCGFNTGKCAGAIVALERDGGCGFGDAQPNDNAARKLRGRQAPGTQFITGPCQSDADCASGCCGFNTGKCAGAIVALERDGGCGFGDAQPNDNAARVLRGQAPAAPGTPPPANNGAGGAAAGSGKLPGTQFITGPCANDGECASGCCGFNTGKCAGAIVALERDGGCGFGDAQPNDNAARKLRGQA
uniref:Biotrophy-associated secreted protein 2 n=1 Tax=Moniliophthora roreri TaxID=221103 RepID=A0A0W0FS04_MONRR